MKPVTTFTDCAVLYALGLFCGIGLMVATGYDTPPTPQPVFIKTEVKEICTTQAAAQWWTNTSDMKTAKKELCGGK